MKFLILAHRWDTSAAAVAAALRRRHPAEDSRLVTLEELIFAPSWAHKIDSNGVVSEVELHDGCILRGNETRVILQRLRPFDMAHFRAEDRSYAIAEMSALLLSWLEGFQCPVINSLSPRDLAAGRTPMRWNALAAEAGLPLPRIRLTSNLRRFPADGLLPADASIPKSALPLLGQGSAFLSEEAGTAKHSVLLAGDEIHGELPANLVASVRAFRHLTGASILQLNFYSGAIPDPRWIFSSADPLPALDPSGLMAVIRFLERVSTEGYSTVKDRAA